MVHLKNSQCALVNKVYMKLYTVIIPKKKSFQTLLKSRNRFRVFDMIR